MKSTDKIYRKFIFGNDYEHDSETEFEYVLSATF